VFLLYRVPYTARTTLSLARDFVQSHSQVVELTDSQGFPTVRRRLSRSASAWALAESHRPTGVWPLLRTEVFPPARDSSQPGAPRQSQPVALGDFVRRPLVEQAESGKSFSPVRRVGPWVLPSTVCWAGEEQPRAAGHSGCAERRGGSH
jgi:hypothetical protein